MKEKNINGAEYVQQLKYGAAEETERLIEIMTKRGYKWAYIIHDKDKAADGSNKEPHIHLIWKSNSKRPLKEWAESLQVNPERLNYFSAGKNQWQNALSYLIHDTKTAREQKKHQYSPEEVKASFNYIEKIQAIRNEIQAKENKAKEQEEHRENIMNLLESVAEGNTKPYKIYEELKGKDLIKYDKQITTAKKAYNVSKMFKKEHSDPVVIVIYTYEGATGKTTLANGIAEAAPGKIFYTTAQKDPFEGYNGEEIIIFDDFTDATLPLSDFKGILNPGQRKTKAGARYANVLPEPELFIITTTQDPTQWYLKAEKGARNQIYRRIPIIIELDNDLKIYEFSVEKYKKAENSSYSDEIITGCFKNIYKRTRQQENKLKAMLQKKKAEIQEKEEIKKQYIMKLIDEGIPAAEKLIEGITSQTKEELQKRMV